MTDPWGFDSDGNDRRGGGRNRRDADGERLRDLWPAFLVRIAVFVGLGVAIWLIGSAFDLFDTAEQGLHVVWLVVLLALVSGGLLVSRRGAVGTVLRSLLAWGAVGLVAVAGYAYRDELTAVWQRIALELSPGAAVHGERSLTVRADPDGAFHMDVLLNGRPVRMLVDTGASVLALAPGDARRAGIDTGRLRYSVAVRTADGDSRAAATVVDSVEVGGLTFRNVPALVLRQGDLSLLGVSILRRFRSFEVRGDRLTLRW